MKCESVDEGQGLMVVDGRTGAVMFSLVHIGKSGRRARLSFDAPDWVRFLPFVAAGAERQHKDGPPVRVHRRRA